MKQDAPSWKPGKPSGHKWSLEPRTIQFGDEPYRFMYSCRCGEVVLNGEPVKNPCPRKKAK